MRAIDGDALITDISELIFVKDALCEYEQVQGLEIALQYIDETPTIEPEQKKGQWKLVSADNAIYVYRCDRCGKFNFGISNFCPNCGAEMTEDTE